MVKIRILGTPHEVDVTAGFLRSDLDVSSVSRHYATADAAHPDWVRVYVTARLNEDVLVVAAPEGRPTSLRAGGNVPVEQVVRGDRLLVPGMGMHVVVRTFPPPGEPPGAAVTIWTKPHVDAYRWVFPTGQLVRSDALIEAGDYEWPEVTEEGQ